MNRRPNRVILTIVALILVAAGAVVLLAAAGAIPLDRPAQLYEQVAAAAAENPGAWMAGILAVGLVVLALGAWLVTRQLRLRPGGRLDTVTVQTGERGRTTLAAVAAADALAADLRRKREISDGHARMVTYGSRPRLLVELEFGAEIDPSRPLEAAEEAYDRLVTALGVESVNVDTQLRPRSTPGSRVQ